MTEKSMIWLGYALLAKKWGATDKAAALFADIATGKDDGRVDVRPFP